MDPLPTLLSQVLVAFIIEFDNEFEHQYPHRTTKGGSTSGPWLVSMAMWSTCMRFVGESGVTVAELEALARTKTNLPGMMRWGYIEVHPAPPRADSVITATGKGRLARKVWAPLFDAMEQRWRQRFGEGPVNRLHESLLTLIGQLGLDLPRCLPILHYGLFSPAPDPNLPPPAASPARHLPALLSQVLLAFALEFERESKVSLAISANLLRVLGAEPLRVRDLPNLTGVSKEAIAMGFTILEERKLALVQSEARVRMAALTPRGEIAKQNYLSLLAAIEQRWQERFDVNALREILQEFASGLGPGLEPYPDNWRAALPRPSTLPHFAMVLHRGGYPDGS